VVKRGAESPYIDWFFVDSLPIRFEPPNYQTCGGAAFLPKLNTDNPGLQSELLRAVLQWTNEGVDGWRLDVPWKVPLAFWRQFREQVLRDNPEAYIVAEVWRGTRPWLDGDTVHGVMNYRLRQLILDYAAFDHMDSEDFDYELHALLDEHGATTPHHLTLLGSHDTPRIRTLCKGDVGRTIIATTLQMTLPGAPMVYYGDEVGMLGENDPDCRRPMVWDSRQWCSPILEATRKLIRLRRTHRALWQGDVRTLRAFNGVYAYARTMGEDTQDAVVVVLNPRGMQPDLSIPLGDLRGRGKWLDALSGQAFEEAGSGLSLQPLPARCAYVLVSAARA
jgi:glycosidase